METKAWVLYRGGTIIGIQELNDTENLGLLALGVLILIPLVIALFRWLWNITMPQVFDLKTITFWQAFRLLLIAGFLFRAGGGGE